MRTTAPLLLIAVLLAGCMRGEAADDPVPRPAAAAEASPVANKLVAGTCPLTLPNGRTPTKAAGMNHGNGRMWTALWPHNVVIAEPDYQREDGSVGMKWPWWRGVKGDLAIEGRRLDGEAPPLRADIPGGYGDKGFQPSGIYFPTEGCWQVTGKAGRAELTFVTLILKAARYEPMAEEG